MRIQLSLAGMLMLLFLFACKKNPSNRNFDFAVTNSWECTVDGIFYSGSVDTSFMEIRTFQGISDTIIYCTGTSADKKSNLHFVFWVNRTGTHTDSVSTTFGQAEFTFDTSTMNHLRAWSSLGSITYHIDSLHANKFKGRFSGTAFALLGGGNRIVTNGKFSFEIGKGSNEPKFLDCKADNLPIRGWISNAKFVSNTLIIEGLGFHADSTFELMIRTGSQLKTGTFKSINGDVGFQAYRPSIVTHFVSDAVGDLTVNIQSVSGNIVEGTFSGTAQIFSGNPTATITSGKFKCRVKDYVPEQDSVDKWGFSESNGLQFPYHTWGGNILNAVRSQTSNSYYLVINGQSDNGNSVFKIKLWSASPITTGLYESGGNYPRNLDSIYFYSSPLNMIYLRSNPFSGMACQIDSIDNQKVVGRFYGDCFTYYASDPSALINRSLRRGYFKAKF